MQLARQLQLCQSRQQAVGYFVKTKKKREKKAVVPDVQGWLWL